MMGAELTIQLLIMRLLAGLILVTVHGAFLAVTAVLLGDQGPRHDGRLTVMPPGHVDMLGFASIVLTGYGWGRPVAIETDRLRIGRWGLLVAVLASSVALLLVGFLLMSLVIPLLTLLPFAAGLTSVAFVRTAARLSVWMALVSLLPIPPLAGAHLLSALGISVPKRAGIYFGLALFSASMLGVTRLVLTPAFDLIAPAVLGVYVARLS